MSLALIITTNEGNILAADSMETYRNSIGDIREGSMSRMKLFKLNSRIGAVACGLSFLENKNIYQQIIAFRKKHDLENMRISDVVDKVYDHFFEKYQIYMESAKEKKIKEISEYGNTDITAVIELECITVKYKTADKKEKEQKFFMPIMEFLIAGYDSDGMNHIVKITIPDAKESTGIIEKYSGDESGAVWIGQTDILVRMIRGWSPQVKRSRYLREMPEKRRQEFIKELNDQEYIINWGTMTFQDAIDFAQLAIKTTEKMQKMTDGTWQSPGSSPGVGGAIDVALTTPEKGFVWVKKKKISIGDSEVNLTSLPDLLVREDIETSEENNQL